MNTIARQLSCTLAICFIIAAGARGVAAQAKYLIWMAATLLRKRSEARPHMPLIA